MKENQRVMLTKKLLKESLVRLLKEESIFRISIRQLCDDAGINRSTFYKYYGSQYDLLHEMENEVIDQIEAALSHSTGADEDVDFNSLAAVFSYLNSNAELCRLLINNTVDSDFPHKLIIMQMPRLKKYLSKEYDEKEEEYMSIFILNGGYSIVKNWINRDHREPSEDIARMLIKAVIKVCQNL